ncbi:MAG: hypothetical protein Q4F24_18035 [Eubacteriales bacterium]|nr:hypothetical protein [Eubacteriales bacterium]
MYKHKDKRTWHAGKQKKKPDYNPGTVTEELLEAVVNAYEGLDEHGKHPSLQAIVDELDCGLNQLKVRKLLITAGEMRKVGEMSRTGISKAGETQGQKIYQSATADEVLRFWKNGKTVDEIMSVMHLSRASVHSYLPYTKIIYKMKESSVGADRMKLYRERKKAAAKLAVEPTAENLWKAIVAFQGYPFKTSKGLNFTYKVKGGELFFSRKEKSITRATVDIAFQKALELGEKATGPKKLGVFGASYLYQVFVRLGVIHPIEKAVVIEFQECYIFSVLGEK